MRKYRVNVNGTVFEVEVEEISGAAAPAAAPAADRSIQSANSKAASFLIAADPPFPVFPIT